MNQLKLGLVIIFAFVVVISVAAVSIFAVYSAPVSSPELTQINKDLDSNAIEFLNVCSETVSISALEACKIQLKEISDRCDTIPGFETLLFCNSEDKIEQFYSTVDEKIEASRNIINNKSMELIDICSKEFTPIGSCQSSMIQLQQDCNTYGLSACDDPRFREILNGNNPPEIDYSEFTAQQEIDEYANQRMLDFIEQCIYTDNQAEIEICAGNAKEMLNLCEISAVESCSDPRLQTIADMD